MASPPVGLHQPVHSQPASPPFLLPLLRPANLSLLHARMPALMHSLLPPSRSAPLRSIGRPTLQPSPAHQPAFQPARMPSSLPSCLPACHPCLPKHPRQDTTETRHADCQTDVQGVLCWQRSIIRLVHAIRLPAVPIALVAWRRRRLACLSGPHDLHQSTQACLCQPLGRRSSYSAPTSTHPDRFPPRPVLPRAAVSPSSIPPTCAPCEAHITPIHPPQPRWILEKRSSRCRASLRRAPHHTAPHIRAH